MKMKIMRNMKGRCGVVDHFVRRATGAGVVCPFGSTRLRT
jgi:hypothetical protein